MLFPQAREARTPEPFSFKAAVAVAVLLLAGPAQAAEPKDWDAFWSGVKTELAAIPADARFEPDPKNSDAEVVCFKASFASLGTRRIHARYCRPSREGRFPGALISPWYGLGELPVPRKLASRGMAALWWQARGYEVDLPSYPTDNSWYILEGIDDPRTYVYRGIVAHGLRALDVLAARPEVDSSRLAAMGASQGGGLSILVAALDPRVGWVAADFPFLCDWEGSLEAATEGPFRDVKKLIDAEPARAAAIRRTVSYFDAATAARRVRARALVQVGLQDRSCTAAAVRKAYGRLKSREKKLVEYPDAGHGDRNADRWHAIEDFLTAALTPQRPAR